ncbi:MAG: hypothetical protein Q9182_004683 [Xanthomendoza sp. 2 TL-2023]
MAAPRSLLLLTLSLLLLLLQLFANATARPARPPSTPSQRIRPQTSSLHLLPLARDPLVISRPYITSYPPSIISIKFHSYGSLNSLPRVFRLLERANIQAYSKRAYVPISQHRGLHYLGEGGTTLDFRPQGGCTWGQWRVVLDAMEEFGDRYRSRDFLFEVRSVDKNDTQGIWVKSLGSGALWTGHK